MSEPTSFVPPMEAVRPRPDRAAVARRVALAAAAAVAANIAIFVIASVADAELRVPESPGADTLIDLGVGAVVVASLLPLIVATLLAVVVARWPWGGVAFTTVVAVGFVVSYLPLLSSETSTGTAVTLALMHPTVAAAAVWALRPVAAGTIAAGARDAA